MGKLELRQSLYFEIAYSNSNVHYGLLCEGDDFIVNKCCKYGQYGLFEHLCFLFACRMWPSWFVVCRSLCLSSLFSNIIDLSRLGNCLSFCDFCCFAFYVSLAHRLPS